MAKSERLLGSDCFPSASNSRAHLSLLRLRIKLPTHLLAVVIFIKDTFVSCSQRLIVCSVRCLRFTQLETNACCYPLRLLQGTSAKRLPAFSVVELRGVPHLHHRGLRQIRLPSLPPSGSPSFYHELFQSFCALTDFVFQ